MSHRAEKANVPIRNVKEAFSGAVTSTATGELLEVTMIRGILPFATSIFFGFAVERQIVCVCGGSVVALFRILFS